MWVIENEDKETYYVTVRPRTWTTDLQRARTYRVKSIAEEHRDKAVEEAHKARVLDWDSHNLPEDGDRVKVQKVKIQKVNE